MAKVSVIIPVYNTAEYLPRCLDSLLTQTLEDIEVICIDDCSTDNSLAVLTNYAQKDTRIKIIANREKKGVSCSRNEGIKAACGEYIGFVDSDDYIDLNFYEKLYNAAYISKADIAKGDIKELFPDGTLKTYQNNNFIIKFHNKFCFNLSFTVGIYRTSLLRQKNIFFNPRLIHTEDLVWLNKIVSEANTVEVVPDVFYYYMRREDSSDTQILSDEKIFSALIGFKYLFIKNCFFAKSFPLDFSFCFQFLIGAVLNIFFRTPLLKNKKRCCKLLLFFYSICTNNERLFSFIKKPFPYLIPYFEKNNLDAFLEFLLTKSNFNQLITDSLRFSIKQKILENKQ